MKTIVLGGGCFWCIEAVYQQINAVTSVMSGYTGGSTPAPNYHAIGDHAEVAKITYDENAVSLATILDIFFTAHDPTTVNRQGNDVGTQYRSCIFYESKEDVKTITDALARAQENWDSPIVTTVESLDIFYPAEDYHQNYYNENKDNPYCQIVINPKLSKIKKSFKLYTK